MPTYNIKNTETNEEFTHFSSWTALQVYLNENPHLKLLPSAPAIVSGVMGQHKTDEGFRDVLRNIKKNHRGSSIDVT